MRDDCDDWADLRIVWTWPPCLAKRGLPPVDCGPRSVGLTTLQAVILAILQDCGPLTFENLAEEAVLRIDRSRRTIRYALRGLLDAGSVGRDAEIHNVYAPPKYWANPNARKDMLP